jgi:hypothetical protein
MYIYYIYCTTTATTTATAPPPRKPVNFAEYILPVNTTAIFAGGIAGGWRVLKKSRGQYFPTYYLPMQYLPTGTFCLVVAWHGVI